jgi:hypothetical protein
MDFFSILEVVEAWTSPPSYTEFKNDLFEGLAGGLDSPYEY